MTTDYVTTEEAARLSGYSETYIRQLVREKKVQADKKGGQYWIDRASLLQYLEAVKQMGGQRFNWRRKQ